MSVYGFVLESMPSRVAVPGFEQGSRSSQVAVALPGLELMPMYSQVLETVFELGSKYSKVVVVQAVIVTRRLKLMHFLVDGAVPCSGEHPVALTVAEIPGGSMH